MAHFKATSFLIMIFFATAAWSAELPARKPGLWETETTLPSTKISEASHPAMRRRRH